MRGYMVTEIVVRASRKVASGDYKFEFTRSKLQTHE